jgi:hypothetical protein
LKADLIRTYLANNHQIINTTEICPYRETIRHLSIIFHGSGINPIAQYQKVSQSAFI